MLAVSIGIGIPLIMVVSHMLLSYSMRKADVEFV